MGLRRLAIRLITPNYTVGAVAVCQDHDGRVLLVRSRQHAGWGLPGGLVQRGEEPVDGLSRELAEELAVDVSAATLATVRSHTIIDSNAQQVTVVFAVTLEDEPVVDGSEVMAAQWFAEPDLPTTLVRGTWESLESIGAIAPRAAR